MMDSNDRLEAHFEHLFSNADGYLDRRLKLAAFYLLSVENLRKSLILAAQGFFNVGQGKWYEPEGTLDSRYKDLLSNRSEKRLRASLLWLQEAEAFDKQECEIICELVQERNKAAHELGQLLFQPNDDFFCELRVFSAIVFSQKLDSFWTKNVDPPIDPNSWEEIGIDEKGYVESVATGFIRHLFFLAFPKFVDEMQGYEADRRAP